MTWVRLETDFTDNPKVARLPDAAFRMYVAGLCYCARHLTDGFIPCHATVTLVSASRPSRVRQYLCDAGLWVSLPSGDYQVNDYLKYQPSKADVERERAKARERKRRQREGDGHGVTPSVTLSPGHGGSHATPSHNLRDLENQEQERQAVTVDLSFDRFAPGLDDPVGRLLSTARANERTSTEARRLIAQRNLSQGHVESIREELTRRTDIRSKSAFMIYRLRTIPAQEPA